MTVLFRAILIVTAVVVWCGGVSAAEMQANAIFLVAKREIGDPRFRETVVLVTQPNQGGPWGVIVNKPLEHRLAEVFPDHEALKGKKDVIYFGGPVAPQGLVVLLRAEKMPPNALRVLKDVYFIGNPDVIDELLQRGDPTRGLRVYAGYSGWGPGQLQNELARGDWYVVPADAETVFEKPSRSIWPELIERASTKHTRSDEGITHHAFSAGGAHP
jgi:putative transcriptional regulator